MGAQGGDSKEEGVCNPDLLQPKLYKHESYHFNTCMPLSQPGTKS